MEPPDNTLAARLNRLFAANTRPDGREWTNEQVAKAIQESKYGRTISHTYIWQLRNGVRDNPTLRHLQGLAHFFGVPVRYFVDDDTTEIDQKLAALTAKAGSRHRT